MSSSTVKAATAAPVASAQRVKSSPFFHNFGIFAQFVVGALIIALVPFGRAGERFQFSAIYDLLFTAKLSDYAHLKESVPISSFLGSSLIASIARGLNLVLDGKVRNFLFTKVAPFLTPSQQEITKVLGVATDFPALIFARLGMLAIFLYSASFLRSQFCEKFKSNAASRFIWLYTLVISDVLANGSRLHSQAFTAIIRKRTNR